MKVKPQNIKEIPAESSQVKSHWPLFFVVVILLFGIVFNWSFWKKLANKVFFTAKIAKSLITMDTSSIKNNNNRTNVLILGISGGTHEGSDLTDTMIFVSSNVQSGDTVMLSIPRDIWLDSFEAKINAAYHYGEPNQLGGGFPLVKKAVEEVLNQPLDYMVLINFESFIKIIDILSGVDIGVERTFDDYKYPIAGREKDLCNGDKEYKCRYETIHFDAGMQYMDGQTALKFIRSRNALGEEGTDFARSQRQQKVITAIKNKLFSYKILLNPKKLLELKKSIEEQVIVEPKLSDKEKMGFISLFLRYKKNQNPIRTISLDYGDEDSPGFLINPPATEYGQWVLIPRTKTWQEIHKYIEEKIYKGY